jgi:hypothetical protein
LLACGLAGADKWSVFRSEPFTVYTNGKDKEAREALALAVQVHHTLSAQFGKELTPSWPITYVLGKGDGKLRLGPGGYLAGAVDPGELAGLLIRENTLPFNEEIENGVIALYSTLNVDGPRVRIGAPIARPDLAWARMHLLFTDDRYSGKTRVLLANLSKGLDPVVSWGNSIGVKEAVITEEAKAHLARGQFGTAALNGKPIDPRRWREEILNAQETAELMARWNGPPPALTGLTMVQLEEQAQKWPRWPEPHIQMAALETEESRRAQRWRHAAQLAMRDVELWKKSAASFAKAELFAEETKCLVAAEKAAPTRAERERLHAERLAAQDRRVEAEIAAKRAEEERERAEIERLRQEALNRIRMAEAKANDGKGPIQGKVEEWWEGPKGDASVSGKLERVDCVGGTLRLNVRGEDKKLSTLTVKNIAQLNLEGPPDTKLSCGLQKPVRNVTVEYLSKTREVTRVKID